MSQAFSESTQDSRSRSRERCRSNSGSQFTAPTNTGQRPGITESVDSAVDTGKGLARIIGAGFKSPMDFSLNVAKGFHNVPKLYGAEVRQVDKVTDFQSGMRTAAKEFGLGLYDGITGIVTDPYKGAKKEGGIGFVKGVGRGIMSVPFRVMGGAWSVPGYAMKGLYQEMIKNKGKNVQNYIIAARIAQGYDEASTVSQQERDEIIRKWKNMKGTIKKKRNVGADQMDSLHSLVQQKRDRKNERTAKLTQANAASGQPLVQSNLTQQNNLLSQYPDPPRRHGVEPEIRSTIPSWRQQEAERTRALRRQETTGTGSQASVSSQPTQAELEAQLRAEEEEDQRELERAIAASVAEASRGDPEEDQLIASAIRASIAELERADSGTVPTQEEEEEALRRAIAASMSEAGKKDATGEEQKMLEETLRRSLLETRSRRQHGSDSEWDTDGTEDNEDYRRIIAESKELAHLHTNYPDDYAPAAQLAQLAQQQQTGIVGATNRTVGDNATDGESTPLGTMMTGETSYTARGHDDTTTDDDEDEELKRILQESERAENERKENVERQRTEEEVVLEYVRKQSLLEEEHRRRMMEGR